MGGGGAEADKGEGSMGGTGAVGKQNHDKGFIF